MFEWMIRSGLDDFSIVQIILFTVFASFIVCQRLDGMYSMILCTVGLFVTAVATNIVMRSYQIAFTHHKDLDGILYTTIGFISAALLVVAVTLLSSMVGNRVGMSAQKLRQRQDALDAERRTMTSGRA